MNGKWLLSCWLIIALLAATAGNTVLAQDRQPRAVDPPTAKADQEPAVPEDSAVAAILETKPSTPGECIRAAKILSDLKRPDLAKQFLQKAIDAKLDAPALTKLADQFGPAIFVQLSARADLHPESRQLADAVLAAQNAELQNPQRVAALIQQLQNPSEEKRDAAFSGLMQARGAAVAAMIEALADPDRMAERPRIRTALAAMGRPAVDPLLGTLDQADPKLKAEAISILGELKAPGLQLFLFQPYLSEKNDPAVRAAAGDALKKLCGALPTKDQAVGLLIENAKNYFNFRQIVPGIVEGKADVWHWDEVQRKCIVAAIPADDAAMALAARLARDAFDLAPGNAGVERLYLATMLQQAAYQKGLSKLLDANDKAAVEAKRLGPKALEDAMAYAVANDHPAAAAAAANILGQIPEAIELLYKGSKPSPLALALRNPDRRLRMAAAEAVVALNPQRPYAGSSYMLPTLAFFAGSSGTRKVLLAGPNVENLRRTVPALSAAGLQADTAVNGRDTLRMAVSSPDYELAMIEAGIDRQPINILLQQLRHDYRSADLRVGIIAKEGFFEQAERVAESDPYAKIFPRPHDDASITWQLEQLSALAPQRFVNFQERERQAAGALDLLAELGRASDKLYDIRQAKDAVLAALYTPSLSRKAIAVLAMVNSPDAQRALVEMAGRDTQSLELRQAAVSAFRENVQEHGILLTTEEIQKQYRQYNASKNRDESEQKILGLILDCLEARAAAKNK